MTVWRVIELLKAKDKDCSSCNVAFYAEAYRPISQFPEPFVLDRIPKSEKQVSDLYFSTKKIKNFNSKIRN